MTASGVAGAVVQAAPVAFEVEATLDKVERMTAESAAGGARLVVFPEAFVSCYPRGLTFGATIGSRTPEGRAWFRRYGESSIDVQGPAVDRLGTIALEHQVHLVIGVIERDGGTLYCTALFLAPSGPTSFADGQRAAGARGRRAGRAAAAPGRRRLTPRPTAAMPGAGRPAARCAASRRPGRRGRPAWAGARAPTRHG